MSLPLDKNANSMAFAYMNAHKGHSDTVVLHRLTHGGICRYRGCLWESVWVCEWARRDGGTVHPVLEFEGMDQVHLCLLSGLPELWQESEEEADWAKSASCSWQTDGVKQGRYIEKKPQTHTHWPKSTTLIFFFERKICVKLWCKECALIWVTEWVSACVHPFRMMHFTWCSLL